MGTQPDDPGGSNGMTTQHNRSFDGASQRRIVRPLTPARVGGRFFAFSPPPGTGFEPVSGFAVTHGRLIGQDAPATDRPLPCRRTRQGIFSTLARWLAAALVLFVVGAVAAEDRGYTLGQVLDAIRQVESGGDCDAVGDGGRAIGPYQIHRGYWTDACEHGGVDWSYDLARSEPHARQAVIWYAARYGSRTAEQIARRHNGGPRGDTKSATLGYWRKVRRAMSGN